MRGSAHSFLLLFVGLLWTVVDGRTLSRQSFRRQRRQSNEQAEKDLCLDPSCILASAEILKVLDTSVDPCNDFYLFSCGGWIKDNDIPGGRTTHGRFEEVDQQNARIIRELLKGESDDISGTRSEAVIKAKDFYHACMNLTHVEEAGAGPLEKVINELGGWSLLEKDGRSIIMEKRNYPKAASQIRESAPRRLIQQVTTDDIKRKTTTGNTRAQESIEDHQQFAAEDDLHNFDAGDIIVRADEEANQQTVEDNQHTADDHSDSGINQHLDDAAADVDRAADETADEDHNLMDVLVTSHGLALDALFSMWVAVDDKDSDSYIIAFAQGGLQLGVPKFYNDTSLLDAYVDLGAIVALLLQFGDEFNPDGRQENRFFESALEKMYDIVEFEQKLAAAFTPSDNLQDPEEIYHKMTVEEFTAYIPVLNMTSYLNKMFQVHNTSISKDDEILVYTPDYFVKLNDILEDTPKWVIHDYIVWQSIFPMLPYLSSSFMSVFGYFIEELYGSSEDDDGASAPLWQICVSETQDAMGEATGALFVQESVQSETKKQVEDMLSNIRQAFIDNLPSLDWMEDATRSKAENKATLMKDKIGWPDWLTDAHKLDEKVQHLQVDRDDSFLNMLMLRRYIMYDNLHLLGKPVDKAEFAMGADTVNAYYDPSFNEMVFPAGIIQTPFYSPNNPMAVNYGGLGVVMGHELTHGFDDSGRKYDEFGNLNNWWDEKSALQYEKRAECMVNQYENYNVTDDVHIDGINSLGENIADNGGAKAAFKAFQSSLKSKSNAQLVYPGLQGYTEEQLFFIGLAQVWCSKSTPESSLWRAMTNVHAPREFRVQGIVSNMDEFAEAFKCQRGSPMNPDQKCDVW